MPRQLQMIWPEDAECPELSVPEGYMIRPLQEGDQAGHVRVMHAAGFDTWNEERSAEWWKTRALPDGVFVIVHEASDEIVATAMASHRPSPLHPFGGELGWVAADPEHYGQGLGRAVCLAVLRRFLDAGYRRIYLSTDDYRLAAIKTYLKMGFIPFLFAPDMAERWRKVCRTLDWPVEPGTWARANALAHESETDV
ncbi:MAG: GNAT family N-acetyltransferase [Candidatus Pacebacteria bacterium]|nr:GNAT family N-acetyltransferase [Candidatus Paceibacterota bacterium]